MATSFLRIPRTNNNLFCHQEPPNEILFSTILQIMPFCSLQVATSKQESSFFFLPNKTLQFFRHALCSQPLVTSLNISATATASTPMFLQRGTSIVFSSELVMLRSSNCEPVLFTGTSFAIRPTANNNPSFHRRMYNDIVISKHLTNSPSETRIRLKLWPYLMPCTWPLLVQQESHQPITPDVVTVNHPTKL